MTPSPNPSAAPRAVEQGPGGERLPLPPMAAIDEAQRAAAQALIEGPRKAVYGPFVPLMRTPALLDRVATLGEALRFGGTLPARVRELVTCVAAAHVGNQFEWLMHQPLALAAGVSATALEAVRLGMRPAELAGDEQVAVDVATELLRRHGIAEPTWQGACAAFGEAGVVELTTLIGYFVMVSWVMNAAHTPSRASAVAPLPTHPL
jgi:4-carboxymuconolactone decarboxylase